MANSKARGYFRQAGSAQAGQTVTTRHEYDSAVQVALDTVQIGRLLAGHRLIPSQCRLIANGLQAAGNVDVYIGTADKLLFNDVAVAATTFADTAGANSALLEGLGVSDVDRDVVMLVNSGFATAPAGGLLTVVLAQVPG